MPVQVESTRINSEIATSVMRVAVALCRSLVLIVGLSSVTAANEVPLLKSGWYLWDPYQYVEMNGHIETLTGLDVELMRAVANRAGYRVHYEAVPWHQHIDDLRTGARDIAAGATYTEARAEFVTFSEPYRYESNVLYLPRGRAADFRFRDVEGMLDAFRSTGFRLGFIEGYAYADPRVNEYIADPDHARFVVGAANDYENFENLVDGRIDGFLADQIVGATTAWRGGWRSHVDVYPLKFSVPIHFMFSKTSVSSDTVEAFNEAIEAAISDGEFNAIVEHYMYPVLLAQTLDGRWFLALDVIGTVAFAVSGVLIASRERYSVVGALVLAALPAVGGGIVRDLLVGREPIGVMTTPLYVYLVLATVFAGFVIQRLFGGLRERMPRSYGMSQAVAAFRNRGVHQMLLNVFDALGLATFTVIGVAVAVGTRAEPLWLWGPALAMVTGAGGGILRDIVRRSGDIASLKTELYAEVALCWGLILSCYLLWRIPNLELEELLPAVAFTVVGAFLTRMAAVVFKLRSPLFAHQTGTG